MDARDLLRRYLQQRRELGESELVLDGLNVDDVMRLVGAAGTSARSTSNDPRRSARESADQPSGDWRTALHEAGVIGDTSPPAPTTAPTLPEGARGTRPAPIPRMAFPADPIDPITAEATDEMPAKKTKVVPGGLVVGSGDADLIPAEIEKLDSLEAIATKVAKCKRCSLYKTATNPVPGEGNQKAELVCVGEAPGAKEDETGRPFVGQAGQLLTKILAAIDLTREQVFICNVLKHRPPGNRNPLPEEVEACSPYLIRQLELIKPKVIIAFGTFAAQTLLNTKTPLGQLRGLIHQYHGIPLVVTYHPAALLRNPAWKRPTWEDVKLARRILDSSPPS